MSVPLDRLYNYLDSIIEDDIIIYRFFPHGSRKLEDLTPLRNHAWRMVDTSLCIICNDQEPLNYNLYSEETEAEKYALSKAQENKNITTNWYANLSKEWVSKNKKILAGLNLRLVTDPKTQFHRVTFLLHSEKRSAELSQYENNRFVGVYWWSHAIIAADWFRYARVDFTSETKSNITHDFLIYNRAWTGTREYRLKFAELLVNNNIHENCLIKFNPTDDGVYYKKHVFKNPKFSLSDINLENYFEKNTADSTASADYVSDDYQNTLIEIVLETLVDDERLHLTEKSLRPIACGQPFMLVATHGSLEYMRSYGFKTFAPYINEDYDTILDPLERMSAIITEMKRITNLSAAEKQKLFNNLKKISVKNKKLFFSSGFHNRIVNEFKENLQAAIAQSKKIMREPYQSSMKP